MLLPMDWMMRRDRARRRVRVGDRQRDALRARPEPDDDELAGLPDLGDPGCLDDEARDVRRELLGRDDRMHASAHGLRSVQVDRDLDR